MNSDRYSVAVIGAGRIGASFDAPGSAAVLTHAHAAAVNEQTTLVAIVDIDEVRGKKAATTWNTDFFPSVDRLFARMRPDIVAIATPDATHVEMLRMVVEKRPRFVILEKPVAASAAEAEKVRALHIDVPVIVNFSRRFDTLAQRIATEIARGECGRVISASGIYDRGIFHNGSHLLDLARMLFGEMTSATPHVSLADYPDGAASVSGIASFERCPEFSLMHGDGRAYSIFELDIIAEKKRMRFADGGATLVVQEAIDDPLFAGFRTLGEPRTERTGLAEGMRALYAHAAAVLDGTEEPRSTLKNALLTHDACARFAAMLK